jgi:hypothetical protein
VEDPVLVGIMVVVLTEGEDEVVGVALIVDDEEAPGVEEGDELPPAVPDGVPPRL